MAKIYLNVAFPPEYLDYKIYSWKRLGTGKSKFKELINTTALKYDIEDYEVAGVLETRLWYSHDALIVTLKEEVRDGITLPYRLELVRGRISFLDKHMLFFGKVSFDCTEDELMLAKFQMPDEFFANGIRRVQ